MDVNEVRVAEDTDFEVLKIYLSRNDGWVLEYEKGKTSVWTRQATESEFKMIRVRDKKKKNTCGLPACCQDFVVLHSLLKNPTWVFLNMNMF